MNSQFKEKNSWNEYFMKKCLAKTTLKITSTWKLSEEFVEKFVQDYWRRFRKKKNKKTKMGEQITVVREKRNVVLRSLENAENETN